MNRDELAAAVERWRHPLDGEAEKSRELILHLLRCSETPFDRRQFAPGHITSTALVWNPAVNKVLLVHHKRLNRWLLPGGHVEEPDASVWDAAAREAREETSVAIDSGRAAFIAGMDVHGIPSNGREPYHLHHDVIVCFRALAEDLAVSEESNAVVWCAVEDMDRHGLAGSIQRSVFRSRGGIA